jgi:hypothetical protein
MLPKIILNETWMLALDALWTSKVRTFTQVAHAIQNLPVQLLHRLDRHKTHSRSLHRTKRHVADFPDHLYFGSDVAIPVVPEKFRCA